MKRRILPRGLVTTGKALGTFLTFLVRLALLSSAILAPGSLLGLWIDGWAVWWPLGFWAFLAGLPGMFYLFVWAWMTWNDPERPWGDPH